jgi:outer membrane protein assembly factor BamB
MKNTPKSRSVVRVVSWVAGVGLAMLGLADSATAQVNVTTYHYNNARTGLNPYEFQLTPKTVSPATFGKSFAQPVDGQIYGQPLYLSLRYIPGKGLHNVVYVTTQNNSVYAFDADNNTGANAVPLWLVSLADQEHGAAAGARAVTNLDLASPLGGETCNDINPKIGITGTPVIDALTNTLFVVAKTMENGAMVHRLHALDASTGKERSAGPVAIPGGVSTPIAFDPKWQFNRAALLLSKGTVYVAFSSHCDAFGQTPFHGWVFAYDSKTLRPQAVMTTTPGADANGASIWQSGVGMSADSAGNVFASTGNGTFEPGKNYGDSVLKLSGSDLTVLDYFTPSNNDVLSAGDYDLGSGGVMLMPDNWLSSATPHVAILAAKEGKVYVLNRDNLGKFCADCNDSQIVQELPAGTIGGKPWHGVWGKMSAWNNHLYVWGWGDQLKSFSASNGRLDPTPKISASPTTSYPGATVSLSSWGSTGGIVWAITPYSPTAATARGMVLHAYDAESLALLYSSDLRTDDDVGTTIKFGTPTVANGHVYVGSGSQLSVYGLKGGLATLAGQVLKVK